MTVLRRTRLLVAALCATVAIGIAVPVTTAYAPWTTPYRVGGPITLDTNLLSDSGATAWSINEYLAANTPLPPLGAAFLAAEQKYGINARFLLAAAMHESGMGQSDIARIKHNLFGYNAYDRDPFRYATAYATYAANIDATAKFMKDFYLTPTGRWWTGRPTLRGMQTYWSSSGHWGTAISAIASSLHLDSYNARSMKVSAPVVRGRLHGGDTATVKLAWTGSLPAGVVFVATWQPVLLDADVIAAAASADGALGDANQPSASASAPNASGQPSAAPNAPASGAGAQSSAAPVPSGSAVGGGSDSPSPSSTTTPGAAGLSISLALSAPSAQSASPFADAAAASAARAAVTVTTRRSTDSDRSTTLAVPVPRLPGQYQLSIDARDTGGTALPAAERLRIPDVAVRVWADQSVALSLAATPDGSGTVVTVTNTGRNAISAQTALPALPPVAGRGSDATPPNPLTLVTLTATTDDAANPTPVVLLAAPLAGTLKPGASATYTVTGIAAATGRAGNWLAAALVFPGNPVWTQPYTASALWFSNGTLSADAPASSPDAGGDALVGPVQPASTPTPASTPVPSASPTPSATPSPRPTLPVSDVPTQMPPPSSAPSPSRTPQPAVKHGTWTYSEHSSAITYRGPWANAGSSGYMGGNVTWSTTPGASATFTFTGSSVTWIGPMGPTRGLALVLIDGRAVAQVSLWRSGFVPQVALYQKRFASVGRHTLTIKVLSMPSHPYVAIDGFIVRS